MFRNVVERARFMKANYSFLLKNHEFILVIYAACHPRSVCENWKEYVVKHSYVN